MLGRYYTGLVGFLTGAVLARTGDELSGPAVLLLGLAVTADPGAAAALTATITAAGAIGGPVFGALLDRACRPGRMLAGALTGYAIGLTALLITLGHLPTLAGIAIAALTGLFNPAIAGGWTAQLARVQGSRDPGRGIALDAMTFSAASLIGPALAGVVAAGLGASAAVAVAAGLVVTALPMAWFLPPADRGTTDVRVIPVPVSLPAQLRAGLAAVVGSRTLLGATAASTVSYVGVGMLVVCCPLLGQLRFGSQASGALLLSVVAVAALAANAALARWPLARTPDRVVPLSAVLLATSYALTALTAPAALLVLTVALAGLAEGPQLTALFAVRHREAPERVRTQVFTTGASIKLAGYALGSALAGWLAAAGQPSSVTACLLTAAGIQVSAALVYLACWFRTPAPAHAA